MDSATRKAKLEELKANQFNQAMTGIPLRYKGSTRTEIVWRIPLDYLIYNNSITQYRNSYFNTYNERADIQRFIDGWLIPRTNKKYCFYAPITENALSELCVDAGLQIKKVFKHDGSCFIIAAKPVDGVQW